ncbi:bifunctional alpha,alpha-trehalose-phosphate synthase (UDP-forming)/trehalose-phosphatase [Candidatus Fermentibacteria bacterium]|nr:bifunctional alpha,alpha-trehalose-phosphate synthase (UDP-forming)/trehalose-phosphatase [Candidatus Fermentibacteria bacterium]
MKTFLIASNRLPAKIKRSEEDVILEPSVGGLATGLRSFYQSYDCSWIGWPGLPSEELDGLEDKVAGLLEQESCVPVHLPSNLLNGYYYGYANRTIWPLFHYFQHLADFDSRLWESYREANHRFADTVASLAAPGNFIWVHDYHLMLLPRLLKERLPDCPIGYFLHIPFPSFELFRLLPEREEILDGLLGSDLVGFHSYEYARHFLSSALRLKGCDIELNKVLVGNRTVKVDVFPMSIDYDQFSSPPDLDRAGEIIKDARQRLGDRKMILSVDRLDYTKGIIQRLQAFELFLERNPALRDKVLLVLLVVPSRIAVPQYARLKKDIDELVGKINGRYGGVAYAPIAYLYRSLDFPDLHALYGMADVGLVTPVRDGMNLVAKEYVTAKSNGRGMLILSEMAGAVMELGEAIMVNPNNHGQVADAIVQALQMDEEERETRMRAMQDRIRRYDVTRWAEDFTESLDNCWVELRQEQAAELDPEEPGKILEEYLKAENSLILLDYDGTLIDPAEDAESEAIDSRLRDLIISLTNIEGNTVVVLSGRTKEDLEQSVGSEDLNLVAEHGVWLHDVGGKWRMIAPLDNRWKEDIHPILRFYADRTPGAYVQEKDYSLVLHYRKSEPDLATIRSSELLEALLPSASQMDLDVLEGEKLIEVRNRDVHKGRAALHWLEKKRWGFIMVAGDDTTDEDTFRAMPDRTFSVKVGGGHTSARYRVKSANELRSLLWRMANKKV